VVGGIHAKQTQSYPLQHDLGEILAQGQSLHDEFAIKNPTDRPIRLTKATALRPCCSSVGPLPAEIPARGTAELSVSIRPGYQSGLMRVEFEVATDSDILPVIRLSTDLHLRSSFEVKRLEGSDESLPIGANGKQRFRVTARRVGAEGFSLPDAITGSDGLLVTPRTPPETKATQNRLVESICEFDIMLPPRQKKGVQRAEVVFHWLDGRTKSHLVGWQTRESLRLSPPGLVMKRSKRPLNAHVVVFSDRRAFKIKKVTSPLLIGKVDLPSAAATRHAIDLMLDQSGANAARVSDVSITTDDPNQSKVALTILILPEDRGND
jgi:hypothetical protein